MGFNPFEPEEAIGRLWHRIITTNTGIPFFADDAARLDALQRRLGVFFRGLGGGMGTDIVPIQAEVSGHRLKWRERLGNVEAEIHRARIDGDTLFLPVQLGAFPDRRLNEALYFWLAGWAAGAQNDAAPVLADPLQTDLAQLRFALGVVRQVLADYPGLKRLYDELCPALLAIRPERTLPDEEAAVEAVICHLLGGPEAEGEAAAMLAAVRDETVPLQGWQAPRKYRPFMPVVLWGEAVARPDREQGSNRQHQENGGGGAEEDKDEVAHQGQRREADQVDRRDSLILFNLEGIISWMDMLNVNRTIEDEDEETARKAAEDMDEIAIVDVERKVATKLSFNLNLSPEDLDLEKLSGERLYPEWDYRKGVYYEDYCRVLVSIAEEAGEGLEWVPDAAAHRRIQAVKRHFEALRPKREIMRGQMDGAEFDMEALIRSRCDFAARGQGSDAIYLQARQQARDLAVAVLIDVSRSTESWIEGRQVIEVEREALAALTLGLSATGDDHAIYSFSSLKRNRIFLSVLKGFDEKHSKKVLSRIGALKPGFYTRMGAAVRHVTGELDKRPNEKRLLLVITDGKPNDLDHYEGRYGIEDSARAIREARRAGHAVFGVTIDGKAQDYFPYIFGRNAFSIVSHAGRLTQALPLLYQHLVS